MTTRHTHHQGQPAKPRHASALRESSLSRSHRSRSMTTRHDASRSPTYLEVIVVLVVVLGGGRVCAVGDVVPDRAREDVRGLMIAVPAAAAAAVNWQDRCRCSMTAAAAARPREGRGRHSSSYLSDESDLSSERVLGERRKLHAVHRHATRGGPVEPDDGSREGGDRGKEDDNEANQHSIR